MNMNKRKGKEKLAKFDDSLQIAKGYEWILGG